MGQVTNCRHFRSADCHIICINEIQQIVHSQQVLSTALHVHLEPDIFLTLLQSDGYGEHLICTCNIAETIAGSSCFDVLILCSKSDQAADLNARELQ